MPEQPPTQEPRTVVVEGPSSGFRAQVSVDHHRFTVDEPVPVGGTDAGPSPYEMLLAALGSCTAMTLRLYADKKRWPLTRAVVKLKHHKVHAKDCADCEHKPAKIDVIDRVLVLEGPLDDAQRAKLLEMAERCPVHQTLRSTIEVNTTLGQ